MMKDSVVSGGPSTSEDIILNLLSGLILIYYTVLLKIYTNITEILFIRKIQFLNSWIKVNGDFESFIVSFRKIFISKQLTSCSKKLGQIFFLTLSKNWKNELFDVLFGVLKMPSHGQVKWHCETKVESIKATWKNSLTYLLNVFVFYFCCHVYRLYRWKVNYFNYGMLKKLLCKLADCEQTCNHDLLHSTFNIVILILGSLYFRHPNSVTDRKYSRCWNYANIDF